MRLAILWAVFAALLFAGFYLVGKRLTEKDAVNRMRESRRKRKEDAKAVRASIEERYGEFEDTSLGMKMERKIVLSGIRRRLPKFDAGSFLAMLGICVVIGLVIGMAFFQNVFVALFLAIVLPLAADTAFGIAAGHSYSMIEDTTSLFISILSNHSKSSTDIVTIMRETYAEITGPIKDLVGIFLVSADADGSADAGFAAMKAATKNRQLRTIIMNLKNCMHYEANYESVLTQMEGQVSEALTAREARKQTINTQRGSLLAVTAISIAITLIIGSAMDIHVFSTMTASAGGQAVLLATGVLYAFIASRIFTNSEVN